MKSLDDLFLHCLQDVYFADMLMKVLAAMGKLDDPMFGNVVNAADERPVKTTVKPKASHPR